MQDQKYIDSSIPCMGIFGYRVEAVCREFLASHSGWVTGRTYRRFRVPEKYSRAMRVP